MSLTRKKTADLSAASTVKAAQRARTAGSDAAANATKATRNATQNAAAVAQKNAAVAQKRAATAAQNAAAVAQKNAAVAQKKAAIAAQNAAGAAQKNAAVAAQNAAALAANAAQNAGDAAQMAAAGVNKGVKQGVYSARSWAAPLLENAADYCTTTVAPKVSSALRSTARQVSPAEPPRMKRSSILTWSLLGAAIVAAAGAAAAVVRYRYRTAIAADSETADEEVLGDSTGSQAAPVSPDGPRSTAAMPTEPNGDTSVNGRVTSTGW